MKLVDLTLSAAESKALVSDSGAIASPSGSSDNDGPKYPWGTSLYLSDTALKKAGISTLPAVGSKMVLMAEVIVTSVSKREDQSGSDQTLDLQMTAICLEPLADRDAKAMYPNSLMTS